MKKMNNIGISTRIGSENLSNPEFSMEYAGIFIGLFIIACLLGAFMVFRAMRG